MAHVVFWTLVPWAVNDALPLDTIEALAWGHEWRWGYDKHPPLSAWAAEAAGILAGGHDAGLYALSALCTAGGMLAAWVLARELLGPRRGLMSLVLLEGVYYHNFTAPEFNVNVLQIPLWGFAILAYWRALSTGRTRWWALLGVCAGLALLTKYLAGALLIAIALHALLAQRRVLRSAGPYLAAAVCAVIFAPHAVWLAQHDYISLLYGVRRAGGAGHAWLDHLINPARFLLAQLAACGALVWLMLVWKPSRRRADPRDHRAFLLFMTIGPVGVLAALSLVTALGLRSMWATPMLLTTGACALAFFDVGFPAVKRRDGIIWSVLIITLPVLVYAGTSELTMRLRDKPKRVNYPGRAIAAGVSRAWREHTDRPLLTVIGNEWDAGLVGWYAPERPSVYIGADETRAPWANDALVRTTGGVIVWVRSTNADNPDPAPMPYDPERFGGVIVLDDLVIPYPTASENPGVRVGVALVVPEP